MRFFIYFFDLQWSSDTKNFHFHAVFVYFLYFQCSSGAHRLPKITIFMQLFIYFFDFQFSLDTKNFRFHAFVDYFVVWDGSGSEFPSSGLAQKNRISFNASFRKNQFFGAGRPPSVIRCQTTQLAPSVNVPRIRRRLGSSGERGRFNSVPTARRTEKKQGARGGGTAPRYKFALRDKLL